LDFAKELVKQLLEPEEEVAATETKDVLPEMEIETEREQTNETPIQREHTEAPRTASEAPQRIGKNMHEQSDVQSASFSTFEPVDLSNQGQRNLDILLDVPLSVTVELGRTKQKVADILDLAPGSI